MNIYKSFSEFEPWGSAVKVWEKIKDANKLNDFEFKLDSIYSNSLSETELNDLLRFDSKWCLKLVELGEDTDDLNIDLFDEFCDHFGNCAYCPFNDCLNVNECIKEFGKNPELYIKAIQNIRKNQYKIKIEN